jgi:hypothetical protein
MLGEARFSRQHDAQILSQNKTHIVLTLLDNAIGDGPFAAATYSHSRALVLLLDTTNMTAAVLKEISHPNKHLADSRGMSA